MVRSHVLALGLLLVSQVATAATPDASLPFIQSCNAQPGCELKLFMEVSKTFRPSREEKQLADYVLALKATSERFIWQQALPAQQDQMGNLVIKIPATGRFNARPAAPIALQSHMDMVLAFKNAAPGEDLRPHFKNGVALETVQAPNGVGVMSRFIQSKGQLTTIGADNGIGVVMALRYLINSKLEHPPLELVFTVQEENGLLGADGMQIPLVSRRLINLDASDPIPGTIIIGSQGGTMNFSEGTIGSEREGPSTTRIRIELGNLAGGHSGKEIHRDRLNAIVGFAQIMRQIEMRVPETRLVSVVSGDPKAINKIANAFNAVISVPTLAATPELVNFIVATLRAMVMSHSDENKVDPVIKAAVDGAGTPGSPVLSLAETERLVATILATPNGVVVRQQNFPDGVQTSSNLGALKIGVEQDQKVHTLVGFMPRSYALANLTQLTQRIGALLTGLFGSFGTSALRQESNMIPWAAAPNSPLLAQALSIKESFNRTTVISVGLEPSSWIKKFPGIDIIVVSPEIQGAHTINEKLNVDSVLRVSPALEKLLASLN